MEDTSKKTSKQPQWFSPSDGVVHGLQVHNSLTSGKVPFVPENGNQVTWYICGPTVYDSAHFGHARNYVTFDVIRRILSDYFNYDVFSVMNITDVDDKIIVRARRNFLMKEYEEEYKILTEKVLKDATESYENYKNKLAKRIAELKEDIAKEKKKLAAKPKKSKAKKLELKAEVKLTKKKVDEVPAVEEAIRGLTERVAKGEQLPATQLYDLQPTREVLSELIDKWKGANVRDQKIFRDHAARYEQEFLEDMNTLGVRPPDVMTRVTEFIPEIITFVKKILDNGYAYVSNGSVYFDTKKFAESGIHHYAKLVPSAVGNKKLLSEGEGALAAATSEKKNDGDFVLWKKSKDGEPFWESEWGLGRPGWHIECSAMAGDILGPKMDIHSGGIDLRFPHHDNEIAQSEAHFGCKQWVNYFLHSGHLHIDGLKMSKSLKNFVTIREMLAGGTTARQIRLYFLTQAWHRKMDFNRKSGLENLKNNEKTLLRFFEAANKFRESIDSVSGVHDAEQKWHSAEKNLQAALQEAQAAVHAALLDNFDTPKALAQLFDLVSKTNSYIDESVKNSSTRALLVRKIAFYVAKILAVFGVEFPEYGFSGSKQGGASKDRDAYLDVIATFRKEVREIANAIAKGQADANALRALTDKMRDEIMPEFGVRLEDDSKFLWTAVPREVLLKEIEDKKKEAQLAVVKNKIKRMQKLEKDLKDWEAKKVPPSELFRGKAEYSKFDEKGLPTHTADGEEVKKSAMKKLTAQFSKQEGNYKKYEAELAKDPQFLEKIQQEYIALKEELEQGKHI